MSKTGKLAAAALREAAGTARPKDTRRMDRQEPADRAALRAAAGEVRAALDSKTDRQ